MLSTLSGYCHRYQCGGLFNGGYIPDLVDIWLFSDITNALMPIPNLIGLLLLNKIVVDLLKDCFKS